MLNIVIQTSNNEPAQLVDIPLENIVDVNLIVHSSTSQASTKAFALQITLKSDTAITFLVNADGHTANFVELTFSSNAPVSRLAHVLKRETQIQPTMVAISEPIDVSRGYDEDESGEESPSAVDLVPEDTDLMAVAASAVTMNVHSRQPDNSKAANKATLETVPRSHHDYTQTEPSRELAELSNGFEGIVPGERTRQIHRS